MAEIKKIRLDNMPLDENSERFVQEIAEQSGVEKIVIFPDSFTKDKYIKTGYKATIPSSVAIATDFEHFYPQFRSRGINCGMSVAVLPIEKDELTKGAFEKIIKAFSYNLPYYAAYALRIPLFSGKYDLSFSELNSVFVSGAKFFATSRGISEENLKAFEFGGCVDTVKITEIKRFLNQKWLKKRTARLRNSFGRYFGGNHFFEAQYVDYLDNEASAKFSIKEKQVVIMLHAAGESLEDVISPDLINKYVKTDKFKFLPRSSGEYEIFSVVHNMLMNYGYAYRLASFAIINDVIKSVFGKEKECRLLIDKSHNHFMEEEISGSKKIIYRHNAERLLPGEFGIISGTYDHKSYIAKGMAGLENSLFSIDHGIGKILDYGAKKDNNDKRAVNLYRIKKGLNLKGFLKKKEILETENEVLEQYFQVMEKENIIKPVVSLRPLFNMKFSK